MIHAVFVRVPTCLFACGLRQAFVSVIPCTCVFVRGLRQAFISVYLCGMLAFRCFPAGTGPVSLAELSNEGLDGSQGHLTLVFMPIIVSLDLHACLCVACDRPSLMSCMCV